jgi:glutamine synthetase
VHGTAKGKFVPLAHWNDLITAGAGFAGPSIWGTGLPRTGPRSEYIARGVAESATALPWMPGVARVVCDGFVGGEAFDACPRQVLKRAVARLAEHGLTMRTGIEPEFFLLRQDSAGHWGPADPLDTRDKPSYDLQSLPRQLPFLRALASGLVACGLDVFQIDHEDAQGQYELNFAHDQVLASADHLMLFKLGAHALAEQQGLVFSMMPKPFADQPGSGLHFHVSLWQGQQPAAPAVQTAFMAGVLAHSAALCAIAAPTVNSYKRLMVFPSLSGTSWAPAVVAHGPNNRTALLRTLPDRFEWRLPDASANPYLASAAMIEAGLDGLERGLDPGPAQTDDLFELSPAALHERGIQLLPQSLGEALDALEADAVVAGALGSSLAVEFVRLKRQEGAEHALHISDWELKRYVRAF